MKRLLGILVGVALLGWLSIHESPLRASDATTLSGSGVLLTSSTSPDPTTSVYAADSPTIIATPTTIGLSNVTNDAQVKRTEIGAPSGVAPLGPDSLVPTIYLPPYILGRHDIALDTNDVAFWRFNEAPSATSFVNDVVGAGNLTSLAGALAGVPGLIGNGIRIASSSSVSGASTIEPSYPLTVSVWVRLESYPSSYTNPQGVWKASGTTWVNPYRAITPFTLSGGNIGALIQTTTTKNQWVSWKTQQLIPLSTWVHFALTYDGAIVRWYYNGQEWANVTQTGAVDYGNHGPWGAGLPPGDSWDGVGDMSVDSLRISTGAKSASELLTIVEAGRGY